MDVDLDPARIEEAARILDQVFRDSPQFVCEQLCAALGRNVLVKIETANPPARAHAAAHPGCVLPNHHPAVAEGAGTIGVELLRAGRLDTVVLPVSDGALITGTGRWIKAHSPATRIIGVCPAAAPAMAHSWRAGHVVRAEPGYTIADSLTMREPAPEAVRRMREVVDDMVLVTDSALLDWMHLAARTLGVLIEPSAAAGLAAIACHNLPGATLATVLTGTDPDAILLAESPSTPGCKAENAHCRRGCFPRRHRLEVAEDRPSPAELFG